MKGKEKKDYSLFNNILYVFKDVYKYKKYLIGLIFLSVISTVGSRFIWLITGKQVIENIGDSLAEKEFILRILGLTIIGVLFMVSQIFVIYWVDPAAYYLRPMFMLRRNRKFFNLSYEKTEYKSILDSRQKSINATSWPQNGVEGLIRKTIIFVSELAICITAMIILVRSSYVMCLIVIFCGTISYFVIDRTSRLEKKLTNDDIIYEKRKEEYFTKTVRDFTYGKDIRLFNGENKLIGTIRELTLFIHKKICIARNRWVLCEIIVKGLDLIREFIMYILLIYLILNKRNTIADFTLYIGCVRNFAYAYQNVAKVFAEMRNCSREVNDFRAFEDICDSDVSHGTASIEGNSYKFEFKNVSFKYPNSENYSLKNINIVIENGTKLAVVGLNGAGKTTFIKLMLGLYKPTEGEILLNGKNIQDYSRDEYLKLFAPVFQDVECFAFTLAENISMKEINETDIQKAELIARKVGLGNKLDEWKDGINTNIQKVLHDDGVTLSGGELQKLGLARALYKGAPIAILDEPTAALDVMAESKMYEDFDEMVKNQIAIYISHRLASTKFCDSIAMFMNGEIIEYGTHENLIAEKGKYFEMFEMQACYYRDNTVKENK